LACEGITLAKIGWEHWKSLLLRKMSMYPSAEKNVDVSIIMI